MKALRTLFRTALALAICLSSFWATGAVAQKSPQPVDLELVLAVDVSGSIDSDEARLQRDGYVAALTDPDVIEAITSGILGRVAMTYIEWAGEEYTTTVADWTVVADEASARAFAAKVARAPIQTALWTSISNIIDHALSTFPGNGFEGTRRVIDISGDGPNNQGGLVTKFRDRAVAQGVAINGLPIVNERASPFGWPALPNLDLYYANCVIGGPGSFMVVANTFADFARAIRKKLILEIADARPHAPGERIILAAGPTPPRETPPCDVGEQRVQWLLEN